jgi:hypothetical protein
MVSNSQPLAVHPTYPMNAYERGIEMNDEERRLNLVLHIVKLDSQIERTADHSEMIALKTQRRNLYVELAAMQTLCGYYQNRTLE